MTKKILIFVSAIFLLAFNACSSVMVKDKSEFVKVNGSKFELGGKPYYFAGTNLWYGCYLGSKSETGDRERLIRELDQLKSLGVTNLRVLAASEESEIRNSLRPAIQKAPGVYNDDLLDGLDFLLNEMGKRGMHAVVFLNNFWEWSGGMSQYNAWARNEKVADPSNPGQDWDQFMNLSASFYRTPKALEQFRSHILKIVTRKNNYNGLKYFEDPTIMAWQLANEPRPGRGPDGFKYAGDYYRWIDETAKYIHSIDENHLVTTGNEGLAGSLESEEVYLNAHKTPNIDYITFHLWVRNWGWYNPEDAANTYDGAVEKATQYIKDHIEFARKLNKPITLEEFGLTRDGGQIWDTVATNYRDRYFQTIFNLIYDNAAKGAPIAGSNFWAWGGEGRARHNDGKWRTGDPFVGDPPQEPQGYNSVFHTDKTTINIIQHHAEQMMKLSGGTAVSAGK